MTKKVPERMCIACRGRDAKMGLVRIVKNKSGELYIDKTGKADGRGAYVCASKECIELAQKKKALERAFKMAIDEQLYDLLKKSI